MGTGAGTAAPPQVVPVLELIPSRRRGCRLWASRTIRTVGMENRSNALEQVLEGFDSNPVAAGRTLIQLLARGGREMADEALAILRYPVPTPGHAHLLKLLIENDCLPEALADPARYGLEEAAEWISRLSGIDPLVDIHLARWVLNRLRSGPAERIGPAARRILTILEQTSSAHRLGPLLVQLLRVPDPRIRSKVALMLGRNTQDVRWALEDPDDRVRANAVEAIWGANSKDVRGTLWTMARDANNRVAGNALLALHKLGEPAAVKELEAMSRQDSPRFRATAAWVMGQTCDAAFLERLHDLETDPEDSVRRNARLALVRMKPAAALGAAVVEQPQAA